ncbi:class I SAM-dependent methyltransferase [Alteribacter populi]|uniref:class I SAM-dependent methyltransferase n=1 Tax=Alteribacter populi TaxID=2011011 RepID=UPI000BBA60DB|nr:SAM-dependent methyltransferase [Alteribacter populi]
MKKFWVDLIKSQPDEALAYHDFIEHALYHPKVGYYMNPNIKLGIKGDFYTSNHVHPVFAWTFARFFSDVIEKEELQPTILEWGAGEGRFCLNVLNYFREKMPDVYEKLSYLIVEASEYHRKQLYKIVEEHQDKVAVYASFDELKKADYYGEGVVFSNELVDAFPVHVVEKNADGNLDEVFVTLKEGHLAETKMTCENKELLGWAEQYGPRVPIGHRTEICLQMKKWISDISEWLKRGVVVTVDYGYSNEEKSSPALKDGSLRGYKEHKMIKNPLLYPGEMDLTAHVQWDAFRKLAEENGLEILIHDTQTQFLLKSGLFSFLQTSIEYSNPFSTQMKQNRAIQSLVYPGGISQAFQVNVCTKKLTKRERYRYYTEDPYAVKENP